MANRTIKKAPYDDERNEYRERTGKILRICRWCGKKLTGRKHAWCGDSKCVHEYLIRADINYARKAVMDRDKGVCAECGTNTTTMRRYGRRLKREDREKWKAWIDDLVSKGWDRRRLKWHHKLWDMDHIHPVEHGGGGCGLDNLQTLCIICHKQKSAEQRKKRDEET